MTAVMQKIQEDAKKKEDEKWERKREVQVKKIKENGIYNKVSRLQFLKWFQKKIAPGRIANTDLVHSLKIANSCIKYY